MACHFGSGQLCGTGSRQSACVCSVADIWGMACLVCSAVKRTLWTIMLTRPLGSLFLCSGYCQITTLVQEGGFLGGCPPTLCLTFLGEFFNKLMILTREHGVFKLKLPLVLQAVNPQVHFRRRPSSVFECRMYRCHSACCTAPMLGLSGNPVQGPNFGSHHT